MKSTFFFSKKKFQFKIKTQISPFILNNRVVREEAEKLLKEIKFSLNFT